MCVTEYLTSCRGITIEPPPKDKIGSEDEAEEGDVAKYPFEDYAKR